MWDEEVDDGGNVKENWDEESSEDEAPKPAAASSNWDDASSSDDGGPLGDWDDDEGGVVVGGDDDVPVVKNAWDSDSSDDGNVKLDWDADSGDDNDGEQAGKPQQPGKAAVRKKILHKKKKHKFRELADKVDVAEEDPDEDPAARKKRMAEEQQKADLKAAEDLFGGVSDSSDDDGDDGLDAAFGERDFDRNANTGDPNFMAADFDEADLAGLSGAPSFQALDLSIIRIKGKDEISKISKSLSDMLEPFKQNAPFVNILVAAVKAMGDKIDGEAIAQAVSALRTLSNDKDRQVKNTKRRARKPKRVEVPAVPKAEQAARARARPPTDMWAYSPRYKEDYDVWGELIGKGLSTFYRNSHFPALISTLLRDLAAHLEPEEIRLIINPLNHLIESKRKATAPKKKASARPKLGGAGKGADRLTAKLSGDDDRGYDY